MGVVVAAEPMLFRVKEVISGRGHTAQRDQRCGGKKQNTCFHCRSSYLPACPFFVRAAACCSPDAPRLANTSTSDFLLKIAVTIQ
jgi:hypothetical protein